METDPEVAEKLQQGICPVCNVARKGQVDKRRALQEHLRRSKESAHVMWFETQYKKHFQHGGERKQELTEAYVIDAIRKAFGAEWSSRIQSIL